METKVKGKIRSPLKYFGGKFYLAASHLEICRDAMATCPVWHERCAGGANFTLQSQPTAEGGKVQTVGDADPLIYNVWRVFAGDDTKAKIVERLKDAAKKATDRKALEAQFFAGQTIALMSREMFAKSPASFLAIDNETAIGVAMATISTSRLSRGGMGKDFAWQDRTRGGLPGEINSWLTFANAHAEAVADRCRNVVALFGDCLKMDPRTLADPTAFVYYDPPYMKETRTAPNVYAYEWNMAKHIHFLGMIADAPAKIAVCGYESHSYNAVLNPERGWRLHKFEVPNHSGQGEKKQRREECLWVNFG